MKIWAVAIGCRQPPTANLSREPSAAKCQRPLANQEMIVLFHSIPVFARMRPTQRFKARFFRGASVLAAVWLAGVANAAPASFSTNTAAVTLDGVTLGTQTTGSGLRNSVVLGDDGLYHLWVIKNGADSVVSGMVHATSADGIHFATQGKLQPPGNYWQLACGVQPLPAGEPIASFVRVSKVGGEWVMAVWHQNQAAGHNWFSYNTSIWRIGADPNALAVTLDGPLPTPTCGTASGPGRFHIGVFGMADAFVYLRHVPQAGALAASLGGNLGRYTTNRGVSPPTTSPRPAADAGTPKQTQEADLFAGTGFAETAPLPPGTSRALVYNAGRAIGQGGALGAYYSFADYNTLAALEKDLWYVESADGGANWGAPTRIYGPAGAQVLVNGLPNTGNFSAPEVTADGRSYFATRDACNNSVMVTPAAAADDPRLGVAMQFNPTTVVAGQTTQLTITVQAPTGCAPAPAAPVLTNVGYVHTLPGSLQFTPVVIGNTCAGTVTFPSSGSVSLAGASLAMGQSCSVVLALQAPVAGTFNGQLPIADVVNDQKLAPASDAQAALLVTPVVVDPPVVVPPDPAMAPAPVPVPATNWAVLAMLAALLSGLGARFARRH